MNTKKLIGTIIGVTMFVVLIAGATFAWLTFGTTVTEVTNQGQTMNFVVDYAAGNNIQHLPILDSLSAKPGAGRTEATLGANEATQMVVILSKHENSPDGHATIWLTTTSNTQLTKDGVVRWAICRDPDVEGGSTGAYPGVTQVDDVCGGGTDFTNALNSGVIKTGSTGSIVLLNDAKLADGNKCATGTVSTSTKLGSFQAGTAEQTHFTSCPALTEQGGTNVTQTQITNGTDYMIEADAVSYFVYLWFDGATITNDHLKDQYDADGKTIKNNLYSGYVHASANQRQN